MNAIETFKKDLLSIISKFDINDDPIIEINKNNTPGLMSTAYILTIAKKIKKSPIELISLFETELQNTNNYKKIDIIKPGFINVLINDDITNNVISDILNLKDSYGSLSNNNEKVSIEYVSANPTGFLHVGHARNAVVGSILEKLLIKAGYNVSTEYYINDAGNQINILAVTVFVHYLWELDVDIKAPEEFYAGDMYFDLAKEIKKEYNDKFINIKFENNLILDESVHSLFKEKAINYFLNKIKEQLNLFKVNINSWISEQDVYNSGEIKTVLNKFEKLNATYNKDGALWLKTTEFNDDKDRTLIKQSGFYTYLLPDITAHDMRIKRLKPDKLINIWGADHHGYINRMKAGLSLLNYDPNLLEVITVQMVRIIKDNKEFKMSKRKGTAVWLTDLIDLIGVDSLRYMLASKPASSHLDLDLDLVTQRNASNPVYYCQYAATRCFSVLNKAKDQKIKINNTKTNLNDSKELEIMLVLNNFSNIISTASKNRAVNIICEYIQYISKLFHSYYADTKIINIDNINMTNDRLLLIKAILQVLKNCFNIIDINLLEKM